MPATNGSHRSPDDLTRLGTEILQRRIEPVLGAEDSGKFIAIDVDNEEFEIHKNDYTAVSRLLARYPTAEIYLGRVGHATTFEMRRSR